MRASKASALALLALALAACRKPETPSAFDYGSHVGVAVETASGPCLSIRSGALVEGLKIRLVTAYLPQTVGEAVVTGKADAACAEEGKGEPGLAHYAFRLTAGSLRKGAPAFALVNVGGPLSTGDDGVTGDLDGDGRAEFFRFCTSAEGVHLTLWRGKPLDGRRLWHAYHYLGYDVEPDCTEAESKPDAP